MLVVTVWPLADPLVRRTATAPQAWLNVAVPVGWPAEPEACGHGTRFTASTWPLTCTGSWALDWVVCWVPCGHSQIIAITVSAAVQASTDTANHTAPRDIGPVG
jgi:hypothetical protein